MAAVVTDNHRPTAIGEKAGDVIVAAAMFTGSMNDDQRASGTGQLRRFVTPKEQLDAVMCSHHMFAGRHHHGPF